MVKHWKFAVKVIAFTSLILFLILQVNDVLTPKKYFDQSWPTTSGYKGFYQMEKHSIDVLFLGSSHAASGFNPQVAYNKYGIRSYNLGCEQQNPLVSYYWLKEALRFQKPKMVVLDTYILFTHDHLEALNTAESCTRMAIDAMKWSDVKWEAVHAICEHDSKQTVNSYIFKNIRFHTRWTALSEQDFTFSEMEKHYELKGYAPLESKGVNVKLDYQPYAEYDKAAYTPMVPLMEQYLNQIETLCREEKIQLILVKTPTAEWDPSKHNTVQRYAEENDIDFIDYNVKENYDSCQFIYAEDMNDDGHSNVWGASKLTTDISRLCSEKYKLDAVTDWQWESSKEYNEHVISDCSLGYLTDVKEYLHALDQDRYTIFIANQYDMTYFTDDDIKDAFSELGLNLTAEPFDSYYAVISGNRTVQEVGHETLSYTGSTRKTRLTFHIISNGNDAGKECSITINYMEYARKQNGLNIVVYSEETRKVVDRAVFDGTIHR